MINAWYSGSGGVDAFGLPDLHVTSAGTATNGTVVVHVASNLQPASECPLCGAPRHVTGIHVTRFRDLPQQDKHVLVCWRRRHFSCTACNRPTKESLPVFLEDHRVTARLADWIWQEAGRTTFMDLARRCGLSQSSVTRLFKEANGRDALRRPKWPYNLGAAAVQIAGLPRPVLVDGANGAVVEIYRSVEWLETHLDVDATFPPSAYRLTLDLGLHELESRFRAAATLHRFVVSTDSVARHSADLMLRAVSEAIAVQAKEEGRAAKTRLILFSRRRDDLGRIGARRMRAWSKTAPALARAYNLKEDLLDLCKSWRQSDWEDWKKQAVCLPELGASHLPMIDYAGVISLIDRYAEAIGGYQQQVPTGEFRNYEKTLTALAGLPPTGTRSFAGTRAALLQKFGRGLDSIGGEEPSL